MTDKNFIVKNGLSVGTAAVLDSSGDLVAGAFGTAAKEAIDDQVNALLTAGSGVSLAYNDGAGTLTITRDAETGDISSVVAGDGLSGGATSGDATVALDLNELTAAAVAVASDSIAIIDANDSNASRKESIVDLVSAMAGTNLTATNGVLSSTADLTGVTAGDGLSGGGTSGAISVALDLNELTAAAVAVASDSIVLIDASDSSGSKKESIADFVTAIAGTNLTASNGVLSSTADLTAVTAGDGLSGGGTSGAVSVALDLSELTAASVDVANDSMVLIDANDSNASRKESIADLATAMAGTNITATNGVLSTTADLTGVTAGDGLSGGGTSGAVTVALDLNELTAATVAVAADSVAIIDATDNSSKKEAIADIITAVAGDALSASAGVLAVAVDNASIETNSDQIRVKAGGVSNAMLTSSSITINGSATALGGTRTLDSDDIGEGSSNLYHTAERVADTVGAMVTGNTETNITVTYEDSNNTLDFVIGTLNQSTTGNAATATALATARTIHGVSFDGQANIDLTEVVEDTVGAMFASNTETGITATYQDGDGTVDLVVDTSAIAETLTNKTLTSPVINTGVSGTAILDEDAMGSNSATKLATQQSIKAYVDATAQTTEEVQDIVGAMFSSNTETGITATYQDGDGTVDLVVSNTDSITEGSTNLYYTNARARASVSASFASGDGAFAYNSGTGVFTVTGPSAAEVRAHLSAGTGVGYSGGAFSIGQAVATNSNVTFADLTVSGNLDVNGTTTTVDSTNTTIADALIELSSGLTGAQTNDVGIIMERGSTGNNAFMGWDESADGFVLGTTTATGATTGALTIATAPLSVGAVTITNASNSGGTARNVYQSTSAPAGGDGAVGDLWILYS